MRIIITGSSGILGRRFMEKFNGHEYIPYTGRVEDFGNLHKFLNQHKQHDVILHLAALVPRDKVENHPKSAFDSNVLGTFNVLESVRQIKGRNSRLVIVSSSHVYASKSGKLKESDKRDPISWYGRTKLLSENLCETFRKSHHMNICVPRIFSYTDQDQSNEYFIPAMIDKISHAPLNHELFIPGLNGARDFLNSDQVVTGLELLCNLQVNNSLNIGSGKRTILLDLVIKIIEILDRKDLKITTDKFKLNLVSDNSKIKKLGLKFDENFEMYLEQMINNYNRNKK
jgi:nucleoside-diphosphate-sugar epimerase